MYRLRRDRMDVIEINLIFLKLASDYDLSQSEFMSSRIQFPLWCDMLLSVGNYSVASNNESCHREQKWIVFDGDHLVHRGKCRPPEVSEDDLMFPDCTQNRGTVHSDQSVFALIQLLVIRPSECIMVAEMKGI